MEASSGRSGVRPIVVDFLGTLFITFCIGVTAAVVLGACVVLMAGEAGGAMREGASAEETRSNIIELALTHHLVTKYTSLIAIDRTPVRPVDADLKMAAAPANLPEGSREGHRTAKP